MKIVGSAFFSDSMAVFSRFTVREFYLLWHQH